MKKKFSVLFLIMSVFYLVNAQVEIKQFPFEEGFEEAWTVEGTREAAPVNWYNINWGSTNQKWDRQGRVGDGKNGSGHIYAHSGTYAARVQSSGSADLNDWLITPVIELPISVSQPRLRFYAAAEKYYHLPGKLKVLLYDIKDGRPFQGRPTDTTYFSITLLETEIVPNIKHVGWDSVHVYDLYEIDLTSYAGNKVQIAFQACSQKYTPGILLDDIVVTTSGRLSPEISDLRTTWVMSNNIGIEWDHVHTSKYYITYRDLAGGVTNYDTIDDISRYALTGLIQGHTYRITVQGEDKNDVNSRTQTLSIDVKTPCPSVTDAQTVDYFYRAVLEDFKNNRACFEIIDNGGISNEWTWYVNSDNASDPLIGLPRYMKDGNYDDRGDDWFLTPLIDLPMDQALYFTFSTTLSNTNVTRNPHKISLWFVEDMNNLQNAVCILPEKDYIQNTADPLTLLVDLTYFNQDIGGHQGRIAVRVNSAGAYGDFVINEIRIQDAPVCSNLPVIELVNRTETTADIIFKNTDEFNIEIEYNTVEFSPGSNALGTQKLMLNSDSLSLDKEYQMKGLLPGTKYYLYARPDCATSEWQRFTFRTELVVRDIPYLETFNQTTEWIYGRTIDGFEIGNWSRIDGNDDMGYWVARSDTSAGFFYYAKQELPRDQWLISPAIVIPETGAIGKFVFTTRLRSHRLSILVSESIDFKEYEALVPETEIFTQNKQNPLYIDYSQFKGKKVYTALRVTSSNHPEDLYLHEFSVRSSDYPAPYNFKINGIANRDITLSWDAESGINKYEVAFCQQPFDPDNMDSYVNIATISTTEKMMTIPSLIRGSKYYFYVRALDENNTSSIWVGPISDVIPCGPEALPFYESFDYWAAKPSNEEGTMGCWRYYNAEYGDRITPDLRIFPEDQTLSLEGGFTPNGIGLGIRVLNHNYDHTPGRRYLISPQIIFPRGDIVISMQASAFGEGGKECKYTVMMSKTGYMIEDFKDTIGTATVVKTSSNYTEFKESIIQSDFKGPIHSGDTVYLAFVFDPGQQMQFDDIVINSYEYDCSTPTDVIFTVLENTANLQIRTNVNTSEVEVIYSTTNFNPNFHYDPNNDNLLQELIPVQGVGSAAYAEGELRNMQPGRKYYIYLRGICAEGRMTGWAGPYEQYSSCNGVVENYPYNYGFSEWTNGNLPDSITCWQSFASSTYKGFLGVSGTAQSGAFGDPINTPKLGIGDEKDEWLISPRFKIDQKLFLSFDYRASMFFDETFTVLVSENDTIKKEHFTKVLGEVHYNMWHEKGKFYADLTPFIGKNIYIAIVHKTKNEYDNKTYKSVLSIDNFSITQNDCPIASQIVLGGVTTENMLSVSWDGENTGKWRVLYKNDYFLPEGQGHGAELKETGEGENTILLPIEKYKRIVFYIGTECSNAWSGPYFAEHCNEVINEFPYIENFENWSEKYPFYGCWELLDNDNDGFSFHSTEWVKLGYDINQAVYPVGRDGSKGVVVFSGEQYAAEFKDNWMISPAFNFETPEGETTLEPVMSFYYKLEYSATPEKYRIYISNSKDIIDMVLIDSVEMNSAEDWKKYSIALANYISNAGLFSSPIYIGIQDYGTAAGGTYRKILIDDFKVDNLAECPPPSDISHEIINCNEVKLRWFDTWGGSDYKIIYSPGSFDIDKGASGAKIVTSNATEGSYSVVELADLEAGTDYCYYLSPQCWADRDSWVGPFYFKTTCQTITEYPYLEVFDWERSQSTDFGCWNVVDKNNDKVTWQGGVAIGTFGSFQYMSGEINELEDIDDWVISPAILLPELAKLRFVYRTGMNAELFELLIGKKSEVWQSDGSFNFDNFEVMKYYTEPGMSAEDPDINVEITADSELDIDFSQYEDEEVYFAFRINSPVADQGYNLLTIKRFELTTNNPCALLPSLPKLIERGTDFLEVSWIPGEDQVRWEVSWKQAGLETYDSEETDELTHKIEGLSPDTYYDIKVRAICGSEQGIEVGPVRYKTNISCNRPTAGSVYVWRSRNSLEVQLIPDGTYMEYIVRYKKAGVGEGYIGNPQIYNGSEIKFTLEGLTPEQNYEIEFKKLCSVSDTSKEQYIYVSTLSICETPNIVVEENNSEDATLSWSGNSTKYYVDYRVQGTEDWINIDPVSESRIQLTKLNSYTYYEVRIQSECDRNNVSDYGTISFRTPATAEYELKLEVNDDLWGEIIRGAGIYAVNTEVEIAALEKSGYEFVNWTNKTTGAILYTEKQAIHKVEADISLVANFIPVCTPPTDLLVLIELKDSTHLRWTGSEGSYILEYKKKLEGWESATRMEVTETEVVLKGLSELDTYTWRVVSKCGEDRYSDTVNGQDFSIVTVGISGVEQSVVEMKLHPNPLKVTDNLHVSIAGAEGKKEWKLYDVNGRQVKSGVEIRNEFNIGLSGLSSGGYILRVEGAGWETSGKIIISK